MTAGSFAVSAPTAPCSSPRPPGGPAAARPSTLPAGYVEQHVQLGYAGTIHGAQGATVDTTHTVLAGTESRQSLYVALSRGRLENHLYLGDGTAPAEGVALAAQPATTAHARSSPASSTATSAPSPPPAPAPPTRTTSSRHSSSSTRTPYRSSPSTSSATSGCVPSTTRSNDGCPGSPPSPGTRVCAARSRSDGRTATAAG